MTRRAQKPTPTIKECLDRYEATGLVRYLAPLLRDDIPEPRRNILTPDGMIAGREIGERAERLKALRRSKPGADAGTAAQRGLARGTRGIEGRAARRDEGDAR